MYTIRVDEWIHTCSRKPVTLFVLTKSTSQTHRDPPPPSLSRPWMALRHASRPSGHKTTMDPVSPVLLDHPAPVRRLRIPPLFPFPPLPFFSSLLLVLRTRKERLVQAARSSTTLPQPADGEAPEQPLLPVLPALQTPRGPNTIVLSARKCLLRLHTIRRFAIANDWL